jgi:CHAT domain-containing protein
VLLGEQASEERMQELDASGELARYRYIHFATHAFYSGARPDLSAIVLRQPGSARADGFLTVAELPRYRLASDLVVLSACETAAGRIVDGEGVMGFAYALLIAGNRNTVAALWKVPDEATARFMQEFFAGVRRGEPHAVALANAKRALQRDPRYAAPLNWAGFVLYGD